MNFHILSPLEMALSPFFKASLVLVSSSSGTKMLFTAENRNQRNTVFPFPFPLAHASTRAPSPKPYTHHRSLSVSLALPPWRAIQWRVGCHFARLARAFEGNSSECFPGLVPCSEVKIKNELAKGSKLARALEGPAEA